MKRVMKQDIDEFTERAKKRSLGALIDLPGEFRGDYRGVYTAFDKDGDVIGHFADINLRSALKHVADAGPSDIETIKPTPDIVDELSQLEMEMGVFPSAAKLVAFINE